MTRAETQPGPVREPLTYEVYFDLPEASRPELTYEDYMAMPVSKRRCEVIDGILMLMASPRFIHQCGHFNITREFNAFGSIHDLGIAILAPADLIIRKRPKLRVRQPDILFLTNARAGFRVADNLDRVQDEGIAPDLVVEIVSPSDRPKAWGAKLADYASIEVREVWRVAKGAGTIEVLALAEGRYARAGLFGAGGVVCSVVLPGLELPVGPLFAAG